MLLHRQRPRNICILVLVALVALAAIAGACSNKKKSELVEKLFSGQNNELDVYDLQTNEKTVLIQNASNDGHDVNGQACAVPDGSSQFIMGEDTNQKDGARQGWAFFNPDGTFVKKILEPVNDGEAKQIEPFGCVFDSAKRLFVGDVGDENFDAKNGKLIVYFPPDYETSCVLDLEIRVAGTFYIDSSDNLYVPQAVPPGNVLKYAPPFPTVAEECTTVPLNKSVFLQDETVQTPFSIVKAPNGNWYLSSVYVPKAIREYDATGTFVRTIAEGEDIGNPAGLAVASDGTIYYADLGLEVPPGELIPGPKAGKGTVRKITFDADGNPQASETIASGYDYPDAVSILKVKQ
jgi:hypothetical protein